MINRKRMVINIPENELLEWLKAIEATFSDWDNEEDSVYDNI